MHIKTSTHILSLAEDHIYNLRRLGVQGDDSWLEARKGEAYNRHLQVKLLDNALHLSFEGLPIGTVPIASTAHVKAIVDFVQYWNLNVGPTDLHTTKTIELVRDWAQLLATRNLRVRCVTWNCAGLLGEFGLKVETWMRLIGSEHDAAKSDVIVLAFQESDNLNRSVKANPVTLQRCADLSSRYLYKTHKLVSSVQLLGLMTLVFVRHQLVPLVSNVRTDTSSTGFLRVWGNKGAVLTRLNLLRDDILGGGLELSIVNCHLSAGEGITQLGRRRWELKEISSKFDVPGLAGPNHHIEDPDHDADQDSISSVSEDESETLADPASTAPSITDKSPSAPGQAAAAPDQAAAAPGQAAAAAAPGQAAAAAAAAAAAPNHAAAAPDHAGRGETASETATLKPAPGSDDTHPASGASSAGAASDMDDVLHMASSKYLIVMGDLNYRVLMPESDVLKRVKKQQWDGLLARDSLSLERQNGEVFRGFEEGAISFAPTYKYEIGSTKLKGRVPSYTDRILFRTRCEHSVESYTSLTDLKSSDHRPVALATRLTVPNVVDTDKRAAVLSRAMKLSDEAENNVRPKLSVDVQQLNLKGPPLSLQSHYIVIRNEGMRPLQWVIENAQEQTGEVDENDPTPPKEKTAASERERNIEREHTKGDAESSLSDVNKICVTPPRGEVSLTRPTSSVRLEARVDILARDYILLVRPDGDHDGGIHQYVFVHIEPTPSYLGCTLKSMPQVDGIPVPVRQCVEYLWDRRVPDMFLRGAEAGLFQQVLHWIDANEPFDLDVLQAADRVVPHASVYAVSHVLMAIFRYLPDQLMGPGPKKKGAKTDWAGVTNYVCQFIIHTISNEYEEHNLNVWATLLYDRNDKRAGANEKRAYLRSMLIVAEQRQKSDLQQQKQLAGQQVAEQQAAEQQAAEQQAAEQQLAAATAATATATAQQQELGIEPSAQQAEEAALNAPPPRDLSSEKTPSSELEEPPKPSTDAGADANTASAQNPASGAASQAP